MKSKIKVIEFFSGIGAQVAALKRLRLAYEVVGISEIDRFAIQSYEAINGSTRNYGDITKIEQLDYADLWTYSSPCQDFSTAGRQAGVHNADGSLTRSGLLLHVERLLIDTVIRDDAPKYLLMENVKGLISKKFKPFFLSWLEKLEQLGYNNYWQVLNAKDYGVPQNRERVFVVSIRKDVDTKGYKFPEKIPLTRKLKDVLEPAVDEKYYLSEEKVAKFIGQFKDQEISYCIDANYWKGTTLEQFLNKHRRQLVKDVIQIGNIVSTGNWDNPQRGRIYSADGCCPSLNTCQGGGLEPKILASRGRNPENPSDRTVGSPTEQRFEVNSSGTSNTLTTVQKDNMVLEPTYRIRKLTERECWRLMAFTDLEFDLAKMSGVSKSQLYKQAGNSIVVDVLVGIFRELFCNGEN